MSIGYIKLYRKLLEWEWKTKPLTTALYVHLLLSASFEDNKWRGISVKSGQLITGRKKLSEQTGLSERQVRTALNHLKSTNEVTIKTTKEYSIISITNWKKYQAGDQQNANHRPTTDQPPTTTKEGKEGKKVKNILDAGKPAKGKKASRIPEDWDCDTSLGEWAMNEYGMSYNEVKEEIFSFKDYWTAASGRTSTKLDWNAAFRTWIRNSQKWSKK